MKLHGFHLRDLFWLVLVAALGCAWWVERVTERNRIASREAAVQQAIDEIEQMNALLSADATRIVQMRAEIEAWEMKAAKRSSADYPNCGAS